MRTTELGQSREFVAGEMVSSDMDESTMVLRRARMGIGQDGIEWERESRVSGGSKLAVAVAVAVENVRDGMVSC